MNRRAVVGLIAAAPWLVASPWAWSSSGGASRRDYLRAHRRFTRELVLYNDFSTALTLQATLLEPEFRDALTAERTRLLRPDDANQAEFAARMAADGGSGHEIVFAADSALPNADKFGPGDDRWNLRLITDGVEQQLVAIERVRVPSPLHEALYVQLDQWSELWIARFTRTIQHPSRVVLIVGGGYGNGEVEWSTDATSRARAGAGS